MALRQCFRRLSMLQPGCRARLGERRFAAPASTPESIRKEHEADDEALIEYFSPSKQALRSEETAWDSTVNSLCYCCERLKKSVVPMFLHLQQNNLLGPFGLCKFVKHFLSQDDKTMVDYCVRTIPADQYRGRLIEDVIIYLEKAGRHDETDAIVKGSITKAFHSYEQIRPFGKSIESRELLLRAVRRTYPNYRESQGRGTLPLPPLFPEITDPPLSDPGSKSYFRAKNFMTRKSFREAYERELENQVFPLKKHVMINIDEIRIVARSANVAYTSKVVKFFEQLLKQYEDGIYNFLVERQAHLERTMFNPEVLSLSTPSSYATDLCLLTMEPKTTAAVMTHYFYRKAILTDHYLTADSLRRLTSEIKKIFPCLIGSDRQMSCEGAYEFLEWLHFDMSDDMSRLPINTHAEYLLSRGTGRLVHMIPIKGSVIMEALHHIIYNTMYCAQFKTLSGKWSAAMYFDKNVDGIDIHPALNDARKVTKIASVSSEYEPMKMPLEYPPLFVHALLTGLGGKLLLQRSHLLSFLTSAKPGRAIVDCLDAVGQVSFKLDARIFDAVACRLNDLRLDRPDYILCIPVARKTMQMVRTFGKDLTGLSDMLISQQTSEDYRGQRIDIGKRLTVANFFRDERPFWNIPVMDFRGRNYSLGASLATTSPDVIRGMMRFSTGVELGARGWEWLQIHLANLHGGCKKFTREEKVEFIQSNMDEIRRSVENPNEGHQWWKQCDSSVQALGVCYEIMDALQSGCPERYVSHMGVHQDGSCNGMQHYSALGRDVEGAKLVNLSATRSKLDLYTHVAKKLEARLIEQLDSARVPERQKRLSRLSLKYVSRKVVKPTVMTTVYGVTMAGAQMQVERAIKRMHGKVIPELARISPHLVTNIFAVLDEAFSVARKIQAWLLACVGRICERQKFLTWTSPLGFVVEQPYTRIPLGIGVKSRFSQPRFVLESEGVIDPDLINVSSNKHMIAFAPNFIHSLDATHMMMTALAMRKSGLAYAAVHDSYWAHAAHVDDLNRNIREQFVALYEQPILEHVAAQLQQNFGSYKIDWKDDIFMNFPKQGSFDIREVLRSEDFFS